MKNTKYGIISLKRDFPTDEACLDFIFESLHTWECSDGGTYKKIAGRKQYQCSKCRAQIAPLAGTIFHKSDTPLLLWFHAILVFSNAKSGISAKQMQRELEVTYKCAWRMLGLIRKALTQDTDKLSGDVEMDTGYFGGRFKSGKDNARQREAMQAKSSVMGAISRGGDIRATVMSDATQKSHGEFLQANVEKKGTRLITDSTNRLNSVAVGYDRHMVHHRSGEYVRGDIHTNTIETFWSHVKRSIKGTHKVVSKKHLQSYLDGFVFHYNNRHSDSARFSSLLGALLQPAI
jgi:hypothetical protein